MFLTTPQIVWHNKEPIFSVDFHYSDQIWRLASSGADHTVKVRKTNDISKMILHMYLDMESG